MAYGHGKLELAEIYSVKERIYSIKLIHPDIPLFIQREEQLESASNSTDTNQSRNSCDSVTSTVKNGCIGASITMLSHSMAYMIAIMELAMLYSRQRELPNNAIATIFSFGVLCLMASIYVNNKYDTIKAYETMLVKKMTGLTLLNKFFIFKHNTSGSTSSGVIVNESKFDNDILEQQNAQNQPFSPAL